MKNNVHSVVGFLGEVGEVKTLTNFTVREFTIKTEEENYPQNLKFDLFNDSVSLVDGLSEGEKVEVMFSLKGREHNGRNYLTARAFKVNKGGSSAKQYKESVSQPVEGEAPVF